MPSVCSPLRGITRISLALLAPRIRICYSSLSSRPEPSGLAAIAASTANAGTALSRRRRKKFSHPEIRKVAPPFQPRRRPNGVVQHLNEGFSPKRRAIRRLESAVAAAITTHEVGRGARLCRATAASPPGSGRDESDDTQTQATRGFAFLFSSCPRRRFRLR